MEQGMPQEAAPQEGGAQGADVMKEAGATLMQQADLLGTAAQAIGQASPEAGKMLQQAGALVAQAVDALGMKQGGDQAQAMPQSVEQGGTNAEPVKI